MKKLLIFIIAILVGLGTFFLLKAITQDKFIIGLWTGSNATNVFWFLLDWE